MPLEPFDQARYQVRLEWGLAGLSRLAAADVVVVVDVLGFSTSVVEAIAHGETVRLEDAAAHRVVDEGALVAIRAGAAGAVVLLGCLNNAAAVAHRIHAEQQHRRSRTSVALIAAGGPSCSHDDTSVRFTVEDQLGSGAIVDALGARGLDDTSPEAAVAGETFRTLRRALGHLLTASGSGQELIARGLHDEVVRAANVDAHPIAPVLRDGVFVAE